MANHKAAGDGWAGLTFQQVEMFRTVYALSDIGPNGQLKATHFALCLQHGRTPTWGVFSVRTGRLTYLYESRAAIEHWHPRKAWRIKQATVTLKSVGEVWDVEERRKHLRQQQRASGS